MKNIFFLIIAAIIVFITAHNTHCVTYANKDITYIAINKLMAYPSVALDEKNPNSEINDADYITPNEFNNMLDCLYQGDYILVKDDYHIPSDKKPLVLIFNNLIYPNSIRANGFVDKLIVDKSGNIATYTSKRSINDRIKYDNDCIPLLESFIASHPLFSHKGARAIIALNNNDGIFGYKTSKTNATSKYDIKRACEIANKLVSLGYTFACSGFEDQPLSDIQFAAELNTWNNYTSIITGKTDTYITSVAIDNEYKSHLLSDNGFNNILSYNLVKNISGKTLREDLSLMELFDPSIVYDKDNRKKPYFSW